MLQMEKNTELDKEKADRIAEKAGVRLQDCNQCGKCTAGCPMAASMDLMPRQIVRYFQLGQLGKVLKSKTIWLCAACGVCAERCPYSIDLPALIENARYEAKRQNICAVKEVDIFTEVFLKNVDMFGKSQEVILEGLYNTLSGNLMQDMTKVPHMLRHGLVRPEVNMVKDREAVSKLIKAAIAEDGK